MIGVEVKVEAENATASWHVGKAKGSRLNSVSSVVT
jgi:hypothetical protein